MKRNSSRYGFAFYIRAIRRIFVERKTALQGAAIAATSKMAGAICTVLVTTVHLSQFDTLSNFKNSFVSLAVRGLQRFVPPKLTIPAFSLCPFAFVVGFQSTGVFVIPVLSAIGGTQCRTLSTADTTKSFSERAREATPQGRRECVGVAEKSLVRNGSEGSEAVPIPAKPLLNFRKLSAVPLRAFFRMYCGLCVLLFRAGSPAWLVNSVRLFIPNALLQAAALAFQDDQTKNNSGGQL